MKATSIGRLALIAGVIGAGNGAAAAPDRLFAAATGRLSEDSRVYAYTVATSGREEAIVEAFDPSLEASDQWQLKLVNGERPTAERVERYREEKAKQLEENPRRSFTQLIDTATVERRDESANEVVYEFRPLLFDADPELNGKFVGTLTIDKADARLLQMEYHNTAPVKPVSAVRLEKMETLVVFETLPDGQPVVKSVSVHTRGVAFLFRKFDRRVVQEYSDYRRTQPERTGAQTAS